VSFDRHLESCQSPEPLSGACPPPGLLASKGRSSPATGKTSRKRHPLSASKRRRHLASLGLAAAVAAPVAALLPKLFAGRSFAGPASPTRLALADGEVAQAAPADVPAAPTSDADLVKLGQEQFKNGQYEEAAETLSKVNTTALPDADRPQVIQTIADVRKAADQRVIARTDFLAGEEARKNNQPIMAASHYKAALGNQYIDNDTKDKATAALTQVASAAAPATTEPAAPPLTVSPTTLPTALTESNTTPAAPAAPVAPAAPPSLSPRDSYIVGKAEYNGGDYRSARRNFKVASAAGYKPPLAQDPPEVYLQRLDAMDQQTQASHQRLADSGQQPPVGSVPTTAPAAPPVAAATDTGTSPATAPATPPVAAATDTGTNPATAPAAPPVAAATDTGTNPATAPATPPVVVAPEAGTAQPPVPSVVNPSSPNSLSERQARAAADLQSTAQLEDIQKQADAYQSKLLVNEANKAKAANDYARARDLYVQAVGLDKDNQAAVEGRNEMLMYLGQSPDNATAGETRVRDDIEAQRQQIQYDFSTAMANANDDIGRGDFAAAEAESERARSAAVTNTGIFSQAEVRQFNTKLADLKLRIEQGRADAIRKADELRQRDVAEKLRREAEIALRNRERTVADLIKKARELTDNAQYREAIGVVDQILILEPGNDYAIGVRPLLEDKASQFEQRRFRERFDIEAQKQLNAAEENKIPYDDILRYPSDWPDLSALRDQTLAAERGINSEERAVQAQLDRKLPEVKFDGVGFSDVIDFLRDVSGANIFVNWKALEAAGIDKNAPVTARLFNVKFSKALQVILDSVSTAQAKVGYTIDDGVITISSGDDLNKNVLTRVYDIRDLIINVPDFTDAPKFDLNSATQQSQAGTGGGSGGGGGGGGSQSGLFGGGTATAKETGKTRDQLVDDITKLIQETVASDSWKETGGQVGAIKELSGQLVVTQTPENHRQLVNLLEQLRETKSIQVTVETRFLTIQRNFLEDVGVDLDFLLNATGNISKKLSPIQINQDSSTYTLGPSTSVPGSIGKNATALTTAATYLDDFQVNLLLRATQAQQFSTIVTAPRITLFNGQRAYVLVATEQAYVSNLEASVGTGSSSFQPEISVVQSGISLDVQATVSADRKYVTLTLRPQLSTLLALREFTFQQGNNNAQAANGTTIIGGAISAAPTGIIQTPEIQITQVKTTVSIPDGGTLLLGGQTIAGELEKEAGVPVLSKIPGLDRLFTNRSMAKDEQILLILCKPTIIIQKEVEQKQFPLLSTKLTGQ